ncbi:MAG: DUF2244 domain-containing protein [Bauldia sp.]|nr:DUF2244 domain-containing protein [Bauldia sp.]
METGTMDDADGAPIFRATISPYRSLSRRGFNILMGVAALVSFIAGIAFTSMGAWPVFGFFGLDVLLLYYAFRRNYRDGRAEEKIEVTRAKLLVRHVNPAGEAREHTFHPYWTRLVVHREEWGVSGLSLASSGRTLRIGDFLPPDERQPFADRLSRALAMARTTAA